MKPEPIHIANRILDALVEDYAGMPECSDHQNKEWRKLFKKADELGILDDDLLEAMMGARLARLGDANLCLVRADRADAGRPVTAECSFSLQSDAAVLRVTELDSGQAGELLGQHRDEACRAPRLVFDLRGCSGGVEQAAYPLLSWLFDEPTNLDRILAPQTVLTNYTKASCEARKTQIRQLKELIASQGGGETTAWLDQSLEAVERNYGKGYVEETAFPASLPIEAAPCGQRVFVLTDGTTADAAEWFAQTARTSARTVLVGAPTRGDLDYSNPVSLSFGGRFVFVYPMSKTVEAAQGRGLRGKGVAPDVPCDPAQALQTALAL